MEGLGEKNFPQDFVDPLTDLNDYSNAERLAKSIAETGRTRFVPGRGFLEWNGYRYAEAGDRILREAAEQARQLFTLAANYADEKARIAVFKHANTSLRSDRLQAAVKLASSLAGVKMDAKYCDSQPHYLGVRNGIVDLRNSRFATDFERSPEGAPFSGDFITLQAGTDFNLDAQCPLWWRFLEDVFDGDENLIDYVQRAVGYALSGHTSEHVLFFLHGSGANGKSVFVNTLKELFGDYSAIISSETILARKHSQQTNDLARLPGRRLVITSELEEGSRWNESLVKSLTGGDPISARFLYAEFFEFIPVFKLFVVGNHRPAVRGADEGIWRRLQLIPFNRFFPPDRRDRELANRLRGELPGILNWAIQGFNQWLSDGLMPPDCVLAATAAYRADEDRVGQFIDERCDVRSELTASASVLYKAYHAWSESRGEAPLSQTRFGTRLVERGFRRVKAGLIEYQGIALRDKESGKASNASAPA
jgi:putative DNA primase/helicase